MSIARVLAGMVALLACSPTRAGDGVTLDGGVDWQRLRSSSPVRPTVPTALAEPSIRVTAAGLAAGARVSSGRLDHSLRLEAQLPVDTTFSDGGARNRTLNEFDSSILEMRLLYRLDYGIIRGAWGHLALGGLASLGFDRTVLDYPGVGTTRTWDVAAGLGLATRARVEPADWALELSFDGGISLPWLSYGHASWTRSTSTYRVLAFDSTLEVVIARRLDAASWLELGYTRRETLALGADLGSLTRMGGNGVDTGRFYGRDLVSLRFRVALGGAGAP